MVVKTPPFLLSCDTLNLKTAIEPSPAEPEPQVHPRNRSREHFYRKAAKSAKDLQQKQDSPVW
jgi:hypothetical protein